MNLARLSSTATCLAVLASAASLATVVAAGWRTGALALAAAAAVTATRVRFSPVAAVALLAVTAVVAHPAIGPS